MLALQLSLEWPASCAYWAEPRVRDFLEELGFTFSRFDGCMYGLRARKDPTKLIRKPWKLACLNTTLPGFLCRTCNGCHEHLPCESGEAIFTQGYTTRIVKAIRAARRRDELIAMSLTERRRRGKRSERESSFAFVNVSAPFG